MNYIYNKWMGFSYW